MEQTITVVDRMNGIRYEKSLRWYEQYKKNGKNLSDGEKRYVLAEGESEPPTTLAFQSEKKNPVLKRLDAKRVNASDPVKPKILTETQELSDETVETFLKATGQVSGVERLVKALGEKRAAEWKDRIDARIAEIQASIKPEAPQPAPAPEPKVAPAPKKANTPKTGGKK